LFVLKDAQAVFQLLGFEIVHIGEQFTDLREVDLVVSGVELDDGVDEGGKVVVERLEDLDGMKLPHFFDLDVIKQRHLLLANLSLENDDEELAVMCFGDLNQ